MMLPSVLLVAALSLLCHPSSAAVIERRDLAPATGPTWTHRLTRLWSGPASVLAKSKKANHLKYLDDIVLRFPIEDAGEAEALGKAVNTLLYLDVWSATANYTDLRIPKDKVNDMLRLLPASMQHSHTRLMHNLAETVIETYPTATEATPLDTYEVMSSDEDIFFQDYQPFSAISAWMKLMAAMFPTHAELINIGTSYEGREIEGLKVGRPRLDGRKKRTVLIVGAAHAREWISVSSVNYMAHSIITGYEHGDKQIDQMVDELDWIFVPTLNVDGYVFTWENERLWRKNRQPTALNFCRGIDLDRSYDFHFDNSRQSTSNPCSDMFPGGFPFEATEAAAFASWAQNYTIDGTEILGLLDFHSYSQQILYPYSFSCTDLPPDLENLRELGIGLAKAIRLRSGEHYEVTSACEGTGIAMFPGMAGSGSMLDYFYDRHQAIYSFQIKLRDTGNYGFLLPKDEIVPTGEEAFNALKYYSLFVLDDGSPTVARNDEL